MYLARSTKTLSPAQSVETGMGGLALVALGGSLAYLGSLDRPGNRQLPGGSTPGLVLVGLGVAACVVAFVLKDVGRRRLGLDRSDRPTRHPTEASPALQVLGGTFCLLVGVLMLTVGAVMIVSGNEVRGSGYMSRRTSFIPVAAFGAVPAGGFLIFIGLRILSRALFGIHVDGVTPEPAPAPEARGALVAPGSPPPYTAYSLTPTAPVAPPTVPPRPDPSPAVWSPLQRVAIDGRSISSEAALYAAVTGAIGIGAHDWEQLGRALDDAGARIELTWRGAQLSRTRMGPEAFARAAAALQWLSDRQQTQPSAVEFTYVLD